MMTNTALSTSTTQSSDPKRLNIQAIGNTSPNTLTKYKTTAPSIFTTLSTPVNTTLRTQAPTQLPTNSKISSGMSKNNNII